MKNLPRIICGGNLLEIKHESDGKGRKGKAGIKKQIQGFSAKARYNLAKELSRICWDVEPAHITLTYGKTYPKSKEHLEALRKWLERRGYYGVWRLEFQERGAPHYHILLGGFSPGQENAFRNYWIKLSGNTSRRGFKATYRESGKSSWYLALHHAKDNQAPDIKVGRWWGWIDRSKTVSLQKRECLGELSEKQTYRIARISRKLSRGRLRTKAGNSFSLFANEYTQYRLIKYLSTV
jgi:hypothetical protein